MELKYTSIISMSMERTANAAKTDKKSFNWNKWVRGKKFRRLQIVNKIPIKPLGFYEQTCAILTLIAYWNNLTTCMKMRTLKWFNSFTRSLIFDANDAATVVVAAAAAAVAFFSVQFILYENISLFGAHVIWRVFHTCVP